MTQCNTLPGLDVHPDRPIEVSFDAPEISSNGGWLLLRQLDEQLSLTEAFASAVPDARDPNKVEHTRLEQIRQRVYQLALGYEDGNDANWLREDRLLKTVCDRLPDDDPLSAQPTVSRFEQAVDMRALNQMCFLLEYTWIRSLEPDRQGVVLDIDSSGLEVHGQQELATYDGYREAKIYHPLAIFDGQTGQLITVLLRPGDVGDSRGAPAVLERLIGRLKTLRPDIQVVVRGDSGFATPRLYRTLEELDDVVGGIAYLLGIRRNSVLERNLQDAMERARKRFGATGRTARDFVGFTYQAQSWETPRYVVGKAEVGPRGENPRFVIGDFREFPPEMVYRGYCERGESEQWIEAYKHQVDAGKMSCSSYQANFFRMILSAVAYRLLWWLGWVIGQLVASSNAEAPDSKDVQTRQAWMEQMARAEFDTLRIRLLKIATIVEQSTRRIHLRMPRHCPWQDLFRQIATRLKRGPPLRGRVR